MLLKHESLSCFCLLVRLLQSLPKGIQMQHCKELVIYWADQSNCHSHAGSILRQDLAGLKV